MCIQCWDRNGRPANWSPRIEKAVELVRALYDIHAVGGPLHVAVDDWNLEDGDLEPYYDGYTDEELDELYDDGVKIADLPAEAPVVAEGLGRSMRQICDELSALLLSMSMEDRMSVLAHHGGYADAMTKGTGTR